MTIDDGVAYGEPFREGDGVPAVRAAAACGSTASRSRRAAAALTGAAFVGWDSTYSFNADGRRIPVETIVAFSYPRAPLSGVAEFTASGNGTFDAPRYDVQLPRQRPVRRRGTDRSGHRHSGAARQRVERRHRRRLAAARASPATDTSRCTRDGRRGADVTLPRQLARSARAAVRAEAVAVHDRGRERLDPDRRRARRISIGSRWTARSSCSR